MSPSPRIAIIGAGPGGLTLACILAQHSIIPTVFEREPSPDCRQQGGTLDLHTHSGQQALRDAGLWDQFLKHARYDAQTLKIVVKSGDIVFEVSPKEEHQEGSRPEIDRTALRNILLESFGRENVNWGYALASVEPSGKQHDLHFKNGKIETGFDLVVGADGAWSRVRSRITPITPFYSGVSMIELDISDSTGSRYDSINELVGKGSMFAYSDQRGITAQRQGTGAIRVHASFAMNEVNPDWLNNTFDANDPAATREKALIFYEDWSPRLRDFIQSADEDFVAFRAMYMLPLDHTWEPCPGLTLLGDAAHLMTPYAGEGVNIAVWDSLELAKKIAEGIKMFLSIPMPPLSPSLQAYYPANKEEDDLIRCDVKTPPRPIDPSARLPVEFRTLSVHVDETTRREATEKRKGTVKGESQLSDLTFHTQTEEEILALFSVSPTIGLDSAQAQRRLATNGPNALSPPPSRTFRKILEWIFGGFGSLLLAASIVCFIAWKPLGEPNPAPANLALALVLLIVLLLNAVFNMWQDISTTRTLASLTSLLPSAVTVLRDGQPTVTQASQLVTGDIVMLGTGVRVPADMRILKSEGLMVDRGVLTGESEPIPATTHYTDENFLETRNIALQGTYCVSGSGIGVVVQVGDGTVFGRIARLSTDQNSNGKNSLTAGLTTLQREILRFVLIIAGCASTVAVIIVILWAAWLRRDYPNYINIPTLLIDVVSVMVAFIPEGLPVAITMSLAKVAHTLSKKKVLCKSLSIVETLGSVNILCSDKTGTLTQNKMSVQDVAIFDSEYTVMEFHDAANEGEGNKNLKQMGAVAAICNSANFASGTEDEPTSIRKVIGDATDSAILRFAHAMRPIETARSAWEDVFKLNFSSKTKFMLKFSKLVDISSGTLPAPLVDSDEFNSQTDYLLTAKGAPDVLYPRCTSIMSPVDGQVLDLTPERLARIVAVQNRWAARGRRVLMLGRRIVRGSELKGPISDEMIAEVNQDLTIIGLVGLIDPLKEDIIETVRICRGAGIRFFMVTGDHPATAVAIAAQAGIVSGNPDAIHRLSDLDSSLDEKLIPQYDPDAKDRSLFVSESSSDTEKSGSNLASAGMKSIVITGADLMVITPSQMEQLCQYDEIVFARTSPEQKLRIVHEFQRRDGVVAMTGDGVNDAPSLKAADCGIAMGDGSDVAREAADMVLLENFEAIVVALEYGRLVYDNLKKTVLYLLPAGSFSELMPIVLNILIGVPQMLSSLQMIIICVGTDVLPALSLALEKPEQGLLSRRPRNVKTDRLADWKLLLHAYGFIGVLESLCAMSMSFWYLERNGVPFSDLFLGFGNWPTLDSEKLNKAQSVYFFTLVIMQWGNLLATRSRKLSIFQHKPSGNWYIFPAMICALAIGIFFSYVPFFQKTFLTRGVPVEHYFLPVAFGIGLLFLDEARKYIVRRYPNGLLAKLAW
ncbi:sodium/potassium-transporting ATPase subunit alpha [Rhizoctonia solani]|uniref:Sodium/potassium-transporting ATPase subunit alpha n=1 Tax=Rhizoctonia solani TaxID=456999 RepID=A0A0K6FYP5_9AGAM|nr:sodium/potassium-transporting ATPase subunit alpha [Rhizoctonia solani]